MGLNSNQTTSVFLGSIILGVWLYLAFFEPAFGTAWGLWGLLGLFMAAAMYGIRLANDNLRITLWVVLGLAIGALITGTIVEGDPMILATLVTLVGGGLIAASMPLPHTAEE